MGVKEHPTDVWFLRIVLRPDRGVKEHPRQLVSQTDAFLSSLFAQSLGPQMEHSTKTYDAATLRHLSSLCWECVAQWHGVIRLAFVTAFFSYLLYPPHSHRTVATHLSDKERGSNHTPRRGWLLGPFAYRWACPFHCQMLSSTPGEQCHY